MYSDIVELYNLPTILKKIRRHPALIYITVLFQHTGKISEARRWAELQTQPCYKDLLKYVLLLFGDLSRVGLER